MNNKLKADPDFRYGPGSLFPEAGVSRGLPSITGAGVSKSRVCASRPPSPTRQTFYVASYSKNRLKKEEVGMSIKCLSPNVIFNPNLNIRYRSRHVDKYVG